MVERDDLIGSKNPQKIDQIPQVDEQEANLLRMEEERSFTVIQVLEQRKLEPSACESIADPDIFKKFIDKGWLFLRPDLFNEITKVYNKERRPLPSIEGILHLEASVNVRRIGGEAVAEYLSLMRGDERFGRNSEFKEERLFIAPRVSLLFRD